MRRENRAAAPPSLLALGLQRATSEGEKPHNTGGGFNQSELAKNQDPWLHGDDEQVDGSPFLFLLSTGGELEWGAEG